MLYLAWTVGVAAWLRHPPGWLLVILWLSFLYVLFRTLIVGILRTRIFQAYLLAKLRGCPFTVVDALYVLMHRGDAMKVVRCQVLARAGGVEVELSTLIHQERAGRDVERSVAEYILAARNAAVPSFDEWLWTRKSRANGDVAETESAGRDDG